MKPIGSIIAEGAKNAFSTLSTYASEAYTNLSENINLASLGLKISDFGEVGTSAAVVIGGALSGATLIIKGCSKESLPKKLTYISSGVGFIAFAMFEGYQLFQDLIKKEPCASYLEQNIYGTIDRAKKGHVARAEFKLSCNGDMTLAYRFRDRHTS